MDNHIYVLSFTSGSETGLAIVTALTERDAIRVLRNSGRYNGFPDAYKILESRNLGVTACIRTELIMESYVNAMLAFKALTTIAPVQGEKGDKGDKGDAGLSAYEIARLSGYTGSQEDWLKSLKADVTKENIIKQLGYYPADARMVPDKIWETVNEESIRDHPYLTVRGEGATAMGFPCLYNEGVPIPIAIRYTQFDGEGTFHLTPYEMEKGLYEGDILYFPDDPYTTWVVTGHVVNHEHRTHIIEISNILDSSFHIDEAVPANGTVYKLRSGTVGVNSISVGTALTTKNVGEVALGKYNVSWWHDPDDEDGYGTAFSVGIGTSECPLNAIEVLDDGRVYIYGVGGATGTDPMDGIDLVTYLDEYLSATDLEAVHYTEQTLTSTQQAQARTNIGAGTYSKPSGGIPSSDLAPDVIQVILTDTAIPSGGLDANVHYALGTLTGAVSITLDTTSEVSGQMNIYSLAFTAGSTAPTITWSSAITKWAGNCLDSNGAPVITAGNSYEVSILDGLAVITEFVA